MICDSKLDDGYYWWHCDNDYELVSREGGDWFWVDGGHIHDHLINNCIVHPILKPKQP